MRRCSQTPGDWGPEEARAPEKCELHLLHLLNEAATHLSRFLILIFKWNFKFFIWKEDERSNGYFHVPAMHPFSKYNFLDLRLFSWLLSILLLWGVSLVRGCRGPREGCVGCPLRPGAQRVGLLRARGLLAPS